MVSCIQNMRSWQKVRRRLSWVGDLMSTKYYDMDVVIVSVLDMCVKELR